jgi:hypothetical protein
VATAPVKITAVAVSRVSERESSFEFSMATPPDQPCHHAANRAPAFVGPAK